MKTISERFLITRCRTGDPRAWDALLRLHHDRVGRFVFVSAPALDESAVAEVCRHTFLRAIDEIDEASLAPSCRIWLLRLASCELHRLACHRPPGAAPPTGGRGSLPETAGTITGGNVSWAVVGLQLRHLLDRLAGPCVALAEFWFFSDASEAEVAAALGISTDLVSRRLMLCLHRLEALDVAPQAGPDARATTYPRDFARRDTGSPLGARFAAYAKGRNAELTHGFPVSPVTREAVLAALRVEFGTPPRTRLRGMLAVVRAPQRALLAVTGGLAALFVGLLSWEGTPARVKAEPIAAPSYWSTKSESPRVLLPEVEADFSAQADATLESAWSITPKAIQPAPVPQTVAAVDRPEAPTPSAGPLSSPPPFAAQVAHSQEVSGPILFAAQQPGSRPALMVASLERPTRAAEPPPSARSESEPKAQRPVVRQRHFVRANPASQFRRNFNSPPMPAVLNTFAVETTEAGMSLIDADGSVYEVMFDLSTERAALPRVAAGGRGAVHPGAEADPIAGAAPALRREAAVPGARSGALETAGGPVGYGLAFQAIGVHRTTGEWVVFRGWLIPRWTKPAAAPSLAGQPAEPSGVPRVPVLAEGDFIIRGEVRLGERTRFPVEASPRDNRI